MKQVTRKITKEDQRDSPRFEVPLYVKNHQGRYVERYGRLGIGGFYFETDEFPLVGQLVEVRLVLLGLGQEVETRGRVVDVQPSAGYLKVAVRFEDIPFHTERMIARWLDLLNQANQAAVAG